MPKTVLTPTQAFDLRQVLHVAALQALMASRRWAPGDLVFQGGTSLHLAYGSPRLSEDLDFMVSEALNLTSIEATVLQRLQSIGMVLPEGGQLSVTRAKDGHNPHAFVVAISGNDLIGGVRVKIEMWKTNAEALSEVQATVAPVRTVSGMQAFVPTAELSEIYADKVFALAARDRLKPRDVFDLHWLVKHHHVSKVSEQKLQVRLAAYPNETPAGWLDKAFARRNGLRDASGEIAKDLKRWLPSSWPMDDAKAEDMARTAIDCLEQGIDMMRVVRDDPRYGADHGGLER